MESTASDVFNSRSNKVVYPPFILVSFLLKYYFYFSDEDGQTPLHIAAEWGKAECVSLLLNYGADIDAKTKDGYDVFWFAKDIRFF